MLVAEPDAPAVRRAPSPHRYSRPGGSGQCPEPSQVVDQSTRPGRSCGDVDDVTDDDVVVPGGADPGRPALEPPLRRFDEGGAAVRTPAVLDADELADGGTAGFGEPFGGDRAGTVQDAQRPAVDLVERLSQPGVGVHAKEHHWRSQRDRGDRRGGHGQVEPAVADGDDGHAAGQARHGGAEVVDELLAADLAHGRPSSRVPRGRSENSDRGISAAAAPATGAPSNQIRLTRSSVTNTSRPGPRKVNPRTTTTAVSRYSTIPARSAAARAKSPPRRTSRSAKSSPSGSPSSPQRCARVPHSPTSTPTTTAATCAAMPTGASVLMVTWSWTGSVIPVRHRG